ncbi:MAG: T9SS type A sorting domain-containing protein [Sphingobacteriales bacterium JAD_PAG50586_3]|nr:MAG: T9SS type A sorting domain-containing protein [Sphingobacteriales bacterium JAD_PAG50586_3]
MFPLNPTNSFCAGAGTNGYSCFSGTSAAAPHVSGVAALLLSKHNTAQGYNNNLAPEDVEYLIRTFATDVGASGYDNFNGMGRLNAGASLAKIDDPEYRIYHSGVYNSRSQSTTQTNQTISLVEPYLNLSAGPYVSDLVEVTDVYNVSFPTGTQVLDGWSLNSRVRGITSSTGFDAENPFASFSSAITNNAGTVTMKTYARHITADFSGHILDVWIPSQASFLKTAFSLHLYKPTVVGVNENSTSHFEVYPNPANSDVNIVMDFPGKQDIIIDILDVQGKLVLKSSYENQSKGIISLPLINLSSGLYMIRVSTDTEQFSSKLLKE